MLEVGSVSIKNTKNILMKVRASTLQQYVLKDVLRSCRLRLPSSTPFYGCWNFVHFCGRRGWLVA